ncbi:MAG: sulfurtransferase [Epsilonproteobacteria bacterium]|nr:sulfurtransferase [Campylobacterota bacterium]
MTVDLNSKEFQDELIKTEKFVYKAVKQFGWQINPDEMVTQRVVKGLTNNKLMYGKRYCPCFVPKFDKSDRICPCKVAIHEEIPKEGRCHCGIFCTEEYAQDYLAKQKLYKRLNAGYNDIQKEVEMMRMSMHAPAEEEDKIDGYSKEQIETILYKQQLTSEELELLLKARERGMVDFKLIDVREQFEWDMGRIKGADFLVPTSNFYPSLQPVLPHKDLPWIVYCHVGSRSAYIQRLLNQQEDFHHIGNLTYGIAAYRGEIEA